jgi:hypothetical protein
MSKLGKRGLRIVGALSGPGAALGERTNYQPAPRNALPTRYPSRARLGDALIDVATRNSNTKAEQAMKAWRAGLGAEERAAIDALPDPERMFD